MKLKKATSYALHGLMYMTRHLSQLPVTVDTISKAEGISPNYLARIFQKLVKAEFVKLAGPPGKGYTFVKPPNNTNLLDLFEAMEDGDLFDDCFMRHCQCSGTPENCHIYAAWKNSP
jgi:Rrf2 family protein